MNPRGSTRAVEAVLFDLDGTLVQTRIASWTVFEKINARFGLGVDGPEEYFDLFRGNVYESIAKLCRDSVQADEVKDAFLTLLREEYSPPLVPGVGDVVRRLAGHCTLAVMSSNAMQVMRRVLTENDLAYCFAHVFGGDVTPDKRTAMRTFLADSANSYGRRCAAGYDESGRRQSPDLGTTVLVTDTAGDVRDAVEVGIRAIGVSWGMHSPEELQAAGADFVALWPQEITAHLLGDAATAPPIGSCAMPGDTPCSVSSTGLPHPVASGPNLVAAPPPAQTDMSGQGCGCGSDPVVRAATVRRERRRVAGVALTSRSAGSPGSGRTHTQRRASSTSHDDLLAAVRRVMRR